MVFFVDLRQLCQFWTFGTLVISFLLKCIVNFAFIIRDFVATIIEMELRDENEY
jgi:hypothetical protein